MKKIQNKQGFAIILAMGITVVLGLISILILDYIVPFSRNIKGVENSSNAYYNAYAGVEETMWFLSQKPLGTGTGITFPSTATGVAYVLQSTTSIIPPAGDGNSEYDKDWNRLDQNTPIQLQLPVTPALSFANTEFIFRIPDIDNNPATATGDLLGGSSDPIINWIMTGLDVSGNPVSLNGKNGNFITKGNINSGTNLTLGSKDGLTLNNNTCSLSDFYENTCPSVGSGVVSKPTLKLSLIDSLKLSDGRIIPYLEYQIKFKNNSGNPVPVPGRYSQIDTAGKSYGYKKTMDIKVPQLSTNQAFDFAVFQ